LAILFTGAACTLLTHHWNACAIHLHVHGGNPCPHRDRELQLDGLLQLALPATCNLFSNGFGRAFYCFGRD
jgi:hypothetical protein